MGRKGNAKDAARGAGLAFVLLAVLTAFVVCGVLYSRNSASGVQTAGQNTEAAEEHNGRGSLTADGEIVFPVILNDGRLQAESVFPYSGINPDAGFRCCSGYSQKYIRFLSERG